MKTPGDLPVYKFKNDRYRKVRGGKTKLIDIYCSACGTLVLVYQKDLPLGALKRCYLDRIVLPTRYSSPGVTEPKDMPRLKCEKCRALIGTPMRYAKHGEDRPAYHMLKPRFTKKNSTHAIGKD